MTEAGKIVGGRAAREHMLAVLLVGLAFTALILFGILGWFRAGPGQPDFWILHSAGSYFLDERMPYGIFTLTARPDVAGSTTAYYAYPPHFSPLIALAALLPLPSARIASIAVNVLACALLAWTVARQMDLPSDPRADLRRAIAIALIVGSPFVAHMVWLGNTSILVMAALTAGWWLAARDRQVAAGILLAAATWKPQLALLPALWFLLERRSTMLVSAGITAFVLAAWHFATFGVTFSIATWLSSLAEYSRASFSGFGYQYSFGLQDLLYTLLGVKFRLEMLAFPILGILWWKRAYFTSLERLALICVTTVMFLPVQDYDLVALAPLAGAVVARRASPASFAVPAVAGLMLFLPARLVRALDIAQFAQWRVAMVLMIAVWLIREAVRTTRREHAAMRSARTRLALGYAPVARTAQPRRPG